MMLLGLARLLAPLSKAFDGGHVSIFKREDCPRILPRASITSKKGSHGRESFGLIFISTIPY